MMPRHHLDPATLVSFAAGALAMEIAVVAATHLQACAHCRAQLREAESFGGRLIEQQHPFASHDSHGTHLREAMLRQLDTSVASTPERPATTPLHEDADLLPKPLRAYFGESYSGLAWRWMAPGVHCIRATPSSTGTLLMLKIAPGRSMPLHGHGGTELTQILRGAYADALGHFAAGDVADLDSNIEHQPVTTPGAPCICVSALDAPLRFSGWLAQRLQPIFKI